MRGALQRVFVPLALAIALGPLAAAGCGGGGNGVGACKQIEEARCNRAASKCQDSIPLTSPYAASGSEAAACIRYYDTACLNGLEVSDPGSAKVAACVKAINNGDCATVETPWNVSDCAWLIPPNTPEASVEAASDAGGDAAEGGDSGDAANE